MKTFACLSALTLTALFTTGAMAQTPAAAPAAPKPVLKTTCADYLALSETMRPQFIYYTVGHGKHGKKDAVFEEVAIEKIKPEVDQFCSVNLSKSAYDKVIASSMASEPPHAIGSKKKAS